MSLWLKIQILCPRQINIVLKRRWLSLKDWYEETDLATINANEGFVAVVKVGDYYYRYQPRTGVGNCGFTYQAAFDSIFDLYKTSFVNLR